jgi:hypothetical protein
VLPARISAPRTSAAVDVDAKLDTGADLCAVPAHVIAVLDLSPERAVRASGFGGPPRAVPVYRMDIVVAGHRLTRIEAVATPSSWALLGRNALRYLDVRLDGPRERLTAR